MAYTGGVQTYGWRKPTLTVELVEGGSLLPNTKYYVMGFMAYSPSTYSANGGPLSDIYEIITTTTALSIKITQKTYRNITAFADNGDSRTKITCARHCLGDNVVNLGQDSIHIDTGSYAGTHAVDEWVDYDTFIIDTVYIDNVAVQCYTDSTYYNRPFNGGSQIGVSYYIGVNYPLDSGGLFNFAYENWDRRGHITPATNPVTFTSPLTQDIHQYCDQPVLCRMGVGVFSSLNDYGSIAINTNATLTLEDIYNEVQASGFIYNCGWSLCGFALKNKFSFFGTIRASTGTSITASGCEIQISGAIFQTSYNFDAIIFTDCVLTSQGTNSILKVFTANNSVLYDSNWYINYTGWVRGTGLIIYGAPRASNLWSDESSTYWDEFQLVTKDIGIQRSKIFRTVGNVLLQQNSYNQSKYEDCDMTPVYWILTGSNKPDIYMAENCIIRHAYSYAWCIRFYSYTQYVPNELKFLNIDSPDDPDNHKKIIRNRHNIAITTRFYRRAEIYVTDKDGVKLSGATVTITDDSSNVYSDTTDVDGYVYLDVLEQKDVVTDDMGYNDPATITYPTDFVITVSLDKYQDSQATFTNMYTNEKQTIALQPLEYQDIISPEVEIDSEPSTIALIELETE